MKYSGRFGVEPEGVRRILYRPEAIQSPRAGKFFSDFSLLIRPQAGTEWSIPGPDK